MASQADGIWREEIQIHSYDVDFTRQATLEAICRRFLEAAWNHAEALGFGFGHLAAKSQLWVLVRLLIRVNRYPQWAQSCLLDTWPRGAKGIVAIREFELLGRDGSQFGAGSSAWVVLDGTTKKPQRLDHLLRTIRTGPDRSPAGQEPSKLPACLGPKILEQTVAYTDIDLNGHVNSGRYVAWLLDSYPFEFHRMYQVELLEINYLGETLGGETVTIRSHEASAGLWSHSIVRPDASEVCRARMVWIPRNRSQELIRLCL